MRGRTEHVHTVAACMLGLHIDVCVSKVCMLMSACLFVCVCVCVCVCVVGVPKGVPAPSVPAKDEPLFLDYHSNEFLSAPSPGLAGSGH